MAALAAVTLLFETLSLPVVGPPVFIALLGLGIVKRLIGLGCGSGRGTLMGCAPSFLYDTLLCDRALRTDDARAASHAAPCEACCTRIALEWTVELVLLALATLPLSMALGGGEAARSDGAAAATAEAVFLSSLRMARTALVFVLPLLFFLASDELEEAGRDAARSSGATTEKRDGVVERHCAADLVYATPQKPTRQRCASERRGARGGSEEHCRAQRDVQGHRVAPGPATARSAKRRACAPSVDDR